jgi:hypothetical protein
MERDTEYKDWPIRKMSVLRIQELFGQVSAIDSAGLRSFSDFETPRGYWRPEYDFDFNVLEYALHLPLKNRILEGRVMQTFRHRDGRTITGRFYSALIQLHHKADPDYMEPIVNYYYNPYHDGSVLSDGSWSRVVFDRDWAEIQAKDYETDKIGGSHAHDDTEVPGTVAGIGDSNAR